MKRRRASITRWYRPMPIRSGQLAEHSTELQFRVTRLEAALHRSLDAGLGFGVLHGFAEEIGVTAKVFGRGEGDGVDTLLDHRQAGRGKLRDPVSERGDEAVE